jgi:4a-hydroxytetrahydrobiopterin dehydratase
MTAFLNSKCTPLEGGAPMSDAQINANLQQMTGWSVAGNAIEKTLRFKNFHETMAFVNALAWICHTEDHHPEVVLSYNRCVVRFNTHSVGGISTNDFICAAKLNALVTAIG